VRLSRSLSRGLPTTIRRHASSFMTDYEAHVAERAAQGIVPLPLDAPRTSALCELLKDPPKGEEQKLVELLSDRVPAGVDEAAYVKAGFLASLAKGESTSPLISRQEAVKLLGTMQGGYNIQPLIDALEDAELAPHAAKALARTILIFDAFHDVEEKSKAGNEFATAVLKSWADAEWFTMRPTVPEKISVTVFKVTGETNTDDLSPAPDAWSRPDIPLHATVMLKFPRDGITDAKTQIEELKKKGFPLAYVGDVVGTGSSRKSATNSILWYVTPLPLSYQTHPFFLFRADVPTAAPTHTCFRHGPTRSKRPCVRNQADPAAYAYI